MEGKLTIDDGTTEKQRPAKIMTNRLEYIKKHILPSLFKNPNSAPFVVPVNHKLLNIPDYPIVIKSAIDLSKIKNRLRSKYYYDSKECLSDFNLMFLNCYVYNLPCSDVLMMGLKLNELLKDKVKLMPADEYEVNFPKKRGEGGKRGRTTGNMKSDLSSIGSGPNSVASGKNIKVTAESCYDMSPTPSPKNRSRDDNEVKRPRLSEELRLCGNVLKEIISIRYRHLNELFLEPVLKKFPALTDYSQIIKNPMDLGTIRTKLEDYQYKNKDDFMSDINLMFDNCYAYNGAESSVSQLARDLRRKFDETYTKIFGLNKVTPTASLNNTSSTGHHHTVTPVVNNISSVVPPTNVMKSEPVSVTITQDPKVALEAYQKDLKHVINAVAVLDNNLKKFAETQGITYESVMHMLPQLNGTSKRNAVMPSSSHHSKKRKVQASDSLTPMFGGTTNSKRGRKTHKSQLPQPSVPISSAQPVISTPNLMFPTTTNVPVIPVVTSVANSYTASLLSTQQPPSSIQPPVVETTPLIQTNHTVDPQSAQAIPPQQQHQQSSQPQSQPQPSSQPNSVFDNLDISAYTSWNARRNLSMMIEKLSGKQLGRVIEIIKENEAAYSDWNLDELDIDFELLLPQTLKELYEFVYSTCQDQIPPLSTPQLDNGINNGVGGPVIGGFSAQQPSVLTTQNNMMIQQSHSHMNNSSISTVSMSTDQLSLNNSLATNNLNPITAQSIIPPPQQQQQQPQQSSQYNSNKPNHNESIEDVQISDSSSNSSESSSSKSDDDDDDESSESDSESES